MKRSTVRFLQVWLALASLCTATIGAAVIALGAVLRPEQRAAALELLEAAGPLPYLLALGVAVAAGFLAAWITNIYFVPLAAAAEATALTALGNPSHRVACTGPVELERLVEAINALAERREQSLRGVEARSAEVRNALDAERNRLAVLMAELPQGVVVCNPQGVILLYNEQARALLCPAQGSAFLGLGRSLHDVVPDVALREAITSLGARDAAGEIDPVVEVTTIAAAPIRIRIAPVAGMDERARGSGTSAGFVLLIDAVPASAGIARPPSLQTRGESARPVFYDFDLFRHTSTPALEDATLAALSYTVFDTETTGLDPSAGDEIVAIGAVRIVNGRLVPGDRFDCLVDPGRPVQPSATRIHGITDAMLRGQPRVGAVLPRFHAFCGDTVLVGHNAAFDLRFLQLKEQATGVAFRQPVLDTLLLAAVLHEHLGADSLDAIAHRFGVEVLARHTALGDALISAEVFLRMLPLLAARGVVTLGQALAASRRTRYAHVRY